MLPPQSCCDAYDTDSVIAYTFSGLKTILEGSNTYTTVYLGEDITMTGGISIPASKTQPLIDGISPYVLGERLHIDKRTGFCR